MSFRFERVIAVSLATLFAIGCQTPQQTTTQPQPSTNTNTVAVNPSPSSSPMTSASPSATPAASDTAASNNTPVTLPVLDAMFADENFAGEMKSKLSLSDDQVEKLKTTAREATTKLKESEHGSTSSATKRADEQIRGIIGDEKTKQLAQFVSERWNKDENGNSNNTAASSSNQQSNIPTDTRIVVNAPAYRMDVFREGKLLKSYKVGIGYPEFPLPTGLRKASSIIFNPTWTPPDEPWVAASNKVQAGKKVEAGDKLNPLGPIKIPIGMPSLIHGGKSAAKLGGFASHGCVGLTDAQIKDFAANLAQISNTEIKKEDLAGYEKKKTETKNVKLASVIPVELRYETITVEDGKLHIYRDVYEHGTNTEENLRKVLEANGVSFDSLTEPERTKIMAGLKQMARDPEGNPTENSVSANTNGDATAGKNATGNKNAVAAKNSNSNSASVTRTIKGAKEFVIEIAALKGKGYPAPLNLSKG